MVSKIRSLDLSLNIILNALSIVIYETFNESQRHCHHLRQSLVFFFLKKKKFIHKEKSPDDLYISSSV